VRVGVVGMEGLGGGGGDGFSPGDAGIHDGSEQVKQDKTGIVGGRLAWLVWGRWSGK
jgi:hypothetical protein